MKHILLIVILSVSGGCGCAGLGIAEIRPGTEQTLLVGQTFTAEYWQGGECRGGGERHIDRQQMRWWTPDSTVLSVDSLTGTVRARAVGDGQVWGAFPGSPMQFESVTARILVHVH